jgi:phenylalanyl-tRNA synthetase beta chain
MKFSYRLLRELVPGLAVEPKALDRLITMHTAESEGIEEWGAALHGTVVARVLEVEPLAGGRNVRAVVDAGPNLGRRQVVCGAPNCRVGLLTAYVTPGTALDGRTIGCAAIGGVESEGMLASGAELGVNRETEGILELPEGEPGSPLPGIDSDFLIEVDNKSLTHRPDLWGHIGMAREVAAFTGLRMQDPVDLGLLPGGEAVWKVDIREPVLCPRYSALVLENVAVSPSPLWLQARLEALGLNPISNVVDVTNYVMAELAQPMHAFDADKLSGQTIVVRRAQAGETFEALNGETYSLRETDLVIADEAGAVALAGVIGGGPSAIGPATRRIVLESANFEAAGIRRTSSSVKLRTDASMRFEKAQDPANTVRGLARAIELFRQVCPEIRVVGGVVDQWYPAPAPPPIELPLDWLVRRLGRPLAGAEVKRILTALEFGVEEPQTDVFSVRVPSWRATKDIAIKDDLLEEVGRSVGYATVPPTAPLLPVRPPWRNREREYHHEVRLACAAQGFSETSNYSFISEEMALRFGMDPAEHLRVANPISIEQVLMRKSLLPGLHRNLLDNARFFEEFRLFEIGNEIHKRAGQLPEEIPHLLAALFTKGDGVAAWFEMKRLAEVLLPGCESRPAPSRGYEHPARSAEVVRQSEPVARIFELHPKMLEGARASFLDLDLASSFRLGRPAARYQPLRRFPTSSFDLSVVTGLRALAGEVAAKIRSAAGEACEKVEYLYSYRGAPLPQETQSLTFRIVVGAADHTLTNEEVTAIRQGIVDTLAVAGYDLRV